MDLSCRIVWLLLLFPAVRCQAGSAESNCGFPGLPLDGSVELYTVNRGYSEVKTEDWSPAKQGHYVFYRCAAGDLRVEYTQRTESRRCESGRWTQKAPVCASKVEGDGDVFGILTKKDEDVSLLVDRRYDTCTAPDTIHSGTSFRLVFNRQYRIYGVKLIMKENPALHNAVWSLGGSTELQTDFVALEFYPKRLNTTDFFLMVGESMSEIKWKSVMITQNSSTEGMQLCEIEIYTLPERCGHPEIPINGRVEWKSSQLTAIYNCNPGFQMEPYTPIRHCLRGSWLGEEPLCYKAVEQCDKTADPIPLVFCIVLSILLAAAILLTVYIGFGYDLVKKESSKNRTLCGLHLYGRPAEVPPSPPPPDFAIPLVNNGYEVPQRIYEEIKDVRP